MSEVRFTFNKWLFSLTSTMINWLGVYVRKKAILYRVAIKQFINATMA